MPPSAVAGLVGDHATASMDVSDGLLGDGQLAAASGLSVQINLDLVPFCRAERSA
ncbi:MAG: hypothetical protein R3B98_06830 [Hyphomonas sp.]